MPRLYHLAPADVGYLVMVSTPVGTASEQEVYRVANQLAADGYSPDDVAEAVGFTRVREWLRASAAEFSPYIDYLQSLVAEKPWAQELGQLDARAWDFSVRTLEETNVRTLLPGIKCPVLALFGDRDTIVDWRESKREYENVLPDVTIHVFPNTDHAMLQNATGSMKTMIASFEAPTDAKPFAPDYLPTLANWLSERVVSTRR
jgi:pimeloyl-ACP methyl ester carboxylesterase